MVRRETDGVWITLKEIVAAPVDEVLACFTTPEGITRWLAVAAQVDLRVDDEDAGTITLAWDRDFKRTLTIAVREYDPEAARIVWDWYPDPLSDESVPVTITIVPDLDHGTRIILREGPFGEQPDTLIAMADAAESWRWYLCNLRSVLETKHDMRSVRPL